MRFKVLVSISVVLAFLLVLMTQFSVFACESNEDASPRCMGWRSRKVQPTPKPPAPKAVTAPLPVPATPVATARRGTGPDDAFEPADNWSTIDPNTYVWYKIGDGINPQRLEVWLDAWGKEGIGFAVYSPEQSGDITPATLPKGRGTVNKADARHDLWWVGQAPAGGTWYVIVTNQTNAPISYKLGYNGVQTGHRDCTGPYWEFLPNGAYVLWPGYCK